MRSIPAVLLCAVLAVPAFAGPPNLIKGGGFDTFDDFQFWNTSKAMDWVGVDAQSRTDSGSAAVAHRFFGVTQCVPITPNRTYDFGARVLLTSDTKDATAYMKVDFYASPNCTGSPLPLASAQTSRAVASPTGRFTSLAGQAFSGALANAALVTLYDFDPNALMLHGSAAALFDDVFLQERGGCVADDTTLCLGGGRLSARVIYYDPQNVPRYEQVEQLSPNSGYFYTYSADDAEVTIKSNDGSFVIGGMTNLPLRIEVQDFVTGQGKVYTNPAVHFLSPIADSFQAQ